MEKQISQSKTELVQLNDKELDVISGGAINVILNPSGFKVVGHAGNDGDNNGNGTIHFQL